MSQSLFCRGSSAKTSVPIILDGKRPSEDDENESRQFIGEEMVPLPQGVPQLDAVIVFSFKRTQYMCNSSKTSLFFLFLQYSEQELNSGEQHGKRSLYTLFFPICIYHNFSFTFLRSRGPC